MSEFTDEATAHPIAASRPRPHRVRRYLIGFGAIGAVAGLVVTGATASSAAPAASAAPKTITLTSSAYEPAGHLTVTLKYQVERGRETPVSVTYSGGSNLAMKHPALVFSLAPKPGKPPAHRRGTRVRRKRPSLIVVRISDVHNFSGTLPSQDLKRIALRFRRPRQGAMPPPGALLRVTVGSIAKPKPVRLGRPRGPQVGLLLSPPGR